MSWGKKILGTCRKVGDKGFIIRISKYADVENTAFHELIHTFPGAYNHGSVFQQYANKINLIHYTEVGTHSPLPKIRFIFCTACPAAPFTRLSSAPIITTRCVLGSTLKLISV